MSRNQNRTGKQKLHPRNLHQGSYDLALLSEKNPSLQDFIFENKYHNQTIDFSNPQAVKNLNLALLKVFYGVQFWDIPEGFLCPPIPGRADYIHYAADLLALSNRGKIPEGRNINVLDIGSGANLIYPILGNASYGWSFKGSEINDLAIDASTTILGKNAHLPESIQIKKQTDKGRVLEGIIETSDLFDLTICNPPFHSSAEESESVSRRKIKNLTGKVEKKPSLNFGGKADELWYEGGELAFISKFIQESKSFRFQVFWFTSLVSKEDNLNPIYSELKRAGVADFKAIDMGQGNKKSRIIAWTYLNPKQKANWIKLRWK